MLKHPVSSVVFFLGALATLVFFTLQSCAHSTPIAGSDSLNRLRQECLDSDGIFHVSYGDYPAGWTADNVQCWYGAKLVEVERIQSLGD